MVKEIGESMARKFLDAHESDLSSADPERAMDLNNNEEGIRAAKELKINGKLILKSLETELQKSMSQKKLIILNPRDTKK